MFHMFLISLAVLALISIMTEEITHINKAKTTLFLGCVAWISLFIDASISGHSQEIKHQLDENLLEIATLWLFLMSTMTFVAYLNAKGLIQGLIEKIFPEQLSVRKLMLMIAVFSLVLSSVCDNVTTTLVSIGLLTSFQLHWRMRRRIAVLIIFSVNSGGVALITGDVTTLMIFLDGHLSMSQLIVLFLPAISSVALLALLFSRNANGIVQTTPSQSQYSTVDLIIAAVFAITIAMTMVLNLLFSIPPVLTFLCGLSVMFLLGQINHSNSEEIKILEYIRQVEFETLLFFLGILLLVGMLKQIGSLDALALIYSQYNPQLSNYFTGIASAFIDNVPMTAALLKAQPQLSIPEWLGLTYAVGVGGSLLVIGSAAGIIAMSRVKELTFTSYLKYFPSLFLCYSVGYGLTLLIANYFFG
ncbi:MAG: sodium:proton antiporter NhaD [Shewanella sp.]|uniref:sodium:proton antiporter NhaD n=1 Tax=Shewanella sp. SNU WT4 TaxID=2590015 RepID=UPI001129E6DF|nr:sodium:proton antiporter NhaD [Shewanella sp. SNU WT4]QDF68454.1 sodium:proton antiporter [Shewanella sp. SNU WT4]